MNMLTTINGRKSEEIYPNRIEYFIVLKIFISLVRLAFSADDFWCQLICAYSSNVEKQHQKAFETKEDEKNNQQNNIAEYVMTILTGQRGIESSNILHTVCTHGIQWFDCICTCQAHNQ